VRLWPAHVELVVLPLAWLASKGGQFKGGQFARRCSGRAGTARASRCLLAHATVGQNGMLCPATARQNTGAQSKARWSGLVQCAVTVHAVHASSTTGSNLNAMTYSSGSQ
jgi:hypothetical protein